MVATDDGLHVFDSGSRFGNGGGPVEELAGHEVRALALGGGGPWAIVDGKELWRNADGRWSRVASTGRRRATCLGVAGAGMLIGTARAHLLHFEADELVPLAGFDRAEGREAWYTPWGAPADVRSISASADGSIYVNVHVGGMLRSTDGGATWRPLLDIEHDVHQVYAPAERPGLVLVAAFDGLGVSRDGGETWTWQNDGLHAHYCRAVALAGDTVILSASAGHHGANYSVVGPYMAEIWPTRLRASGMGLAYGVGNSGKILGPLGLALILGANDLIKPSANLASLGPAFTYFACWYVVGIIAFGFVGFETKGRSLEEIDGRFAAHVEAAPAKGIAG